MSASFYFDKTDILLYVSSIKHEILWPNIQTIWRFNNNNDVKIYMYVK